MKGCVICETGKYPLFSTDLCEEHNICVDCGIMRKDLDYVPWGARDGAFLCRPCEVATRKASIVKRAKEGFEHEFTQEAVCPYCGCECGDSWEFPEYTEQECYDCKKDFKIERIISCEYVTEKIE